MKSKEAIKKTIKNIKEAIPKKTDLIEIKELIAFKSALKWVIGDDE